MIRNATTQDIPVLVKLGEAMHAESPRYRRMSWNPGKVCGLMDWCLANPDAGLLLVAERDGKVIGGFIGLCQPHYFSDDLMASDLALFVEPGKRGGLAAARLLQAFKVWARARGAVDIGAGVTTGVCDELAARLYRSVGFEPAGLLFKLKVEA